MAHGAATHTTLTRVDAASLGIILSRVLAKRSREWCLPFGLNKKRQKQEENGENGKKTGEKKGKKRKNRKKTEKMEETTEKKRKQHRSGSGDPFCEIPIEESCERQSRQLALASTSRTILSTVRPVLPEVVFRLRKQQH